MQLPMELPCLALPVQANSYAQNKYKRLKQALKDAQQLNMRGKGARKKEKQ